MKFKKSISEQNPGEDPQIHFTSNKDFLKENSNSCPKSTAKSIPKWYKDADIFAINPQTNTPWINPNDGGKVPTWKACPAILDVMSTGYVLRTPCDIEFYYDNNRISARVLEEENKNFIDMRHPLPQFITPMGYDENHFSWNVDWGISVSEGYSVLYTHPMNRFDLPFISTSGIVDNDKVHLSGSLPFFLFKGWTGILPAGTPYSQLVPFKRENWDSEILIENTKNIPMKNYLNSLKYRVKNGGVYKNNIWERRLYR
jgi:hypothetical protein